MAFAARDLELRMPSQATFSFGLKGRSVITDVKDTPCCNGTMILRLAIFVALLTMAPPSAWCCCRHSATTTCHDVIESPSQPDDCHTCPHHSHASKEAPKSGDLPAKKGQDEPCRCQMSQSDLGIVSSPERASFDEEGFTPFVHTNESLAIEPVTSGLSRFGKVSSSSSLGTRARILRC